MPAVSPTCRARLDFLSLGRTVSVRSSPCWWHVLHQRCGPVSPESFSRASTRAPANRPCRRHGGGGRHDRADHPRAQSPGRHRHTEPAVISHQTNGSRRWDRTGRGDTGRTGAIPDRTRRIADIALVIAGIGFGLIGFADDLSGNLPVRVRLTLQLVIAVLVVAMLWRHTSAVDVSRSFWSVRRRFCGLSRSSTHSISWTASTGFRAQRRSSPGSRSGCMPGRSPRVDTVSGRVCPGRRFDRFRSVQFPDRPGVPR